MTFDVAVQFRGAVPKVLSVSKVPLIEDGTITGVHVVCRDISELTASHQLIAQQAHTLNTLFESITDAVFLMDNEWRITYLNSEVERLLKLKEEQILGKGYWEVFPETGSEVFYEHFVHAKRVGHAVKFEAYSIPREMWLEVKAYPSSEGLSVYFSDVTPRKETEARQERLAQDLYQHNQDLQEFNYLVSHNLRGPLANALGLARMLHPHGSEQEQVQEHLILSLQQLDGLLHELTTILSVRETHGVVGNRTVVPLGQVLAQVQHRVRESLCQSGGTLTVLMPDELTVYGTHTQLFNIFRNLLVNAIAYREPQRPLRVVVTGQAIPTGGVHVTVADNGSGFDRARAGADVFKLYKRFHAEPSGRGLGLYFVQAYVTALGGHITVQSQPGIGTEFSLYLP